MKVDAKRRARNVFGGGKQHDSQERGRPQKVKAHVESQRDSGLKIFEGSSRDGLYFFYSFKRAHWVKRHACGLKIFEGSSRDGLYFFPANLRLAIFNRF